MLLCRNDEFGVRAKNKIIFVQFSSFVTIKFGKHFSRFAWGLFPFFFLYYFLWIQVHGNLSLWSNCICSYQPNYEFFTNLGDLNNLLLHPKFYKCKARTLLHDRDLKNLVNYFAVSEVATYVESSYKVGGWSCRC